MQVLVQQQQADLYGQRHQRRPFCEMLYQRGPLLQLRPRQLQEADAICILSQLEPWQQQLQVFAVEPEIQRGDLKNFTESQTETPLVGSITLVKHDEMAFVHFQELIQTLLHSANQENTRSF
jgi:hypothetical protein